MRRGALAGATVGVVVSLALSPASASPPDVPDERPTLVAGALAAAHRIDGVLDEPEWASAPASGDLVMVEPRQGERPSGRTVVKVLAGPKALVFGIRCEDPEPSGIVTFTKERDGDFESEDHVVVVLDPFQDGRTGYVFAVNPGRRAIRRPRRAGRRGGGPELGRRVGSGHEPRRRGLDRRDPASRSRS